jgi:hypothetical protein
VGDIVYADTTTSLAKLADVAVGNALISGGVAAAPSYGKIGLATHVSGTLPVANGGTGQTTALIPSGTVMMFVQTAAPTGWTKSTTHNNKALRVVSGTAASGGSVAFTTAFASQAVSGSIGSTTATGTVGGTALTEAQLPSHTHTFSGTTSNPSVSLTGTFDAGKPPGSSGIFATQITGLAGGGSGAQASATRYSMNATHTHTYSGTTAGAGSGSTHSHTFTGTAHDHTFTGTAINLAVQYVDVIIATKD